MKNKSPAFSVMLILSLFINLLVSPFALCPALAAALPVIDDFESGLPQRDRCQRRCDWIHHVQ